MGVQGHPRAQCHCNMRPMQATQKNEATQKEATKNMGPPKKGATKNMGPPKNEATKSTGHHQGNRAQASDTGLLKLECQLGMATLKNQSHSTTTLSTTGNESEIGSFGLRGPNRGTGH